MAKKVELDVEIDEKGKVHFHVKGAKGKACIEYLTLFEKVLGPATETAYTSEYYEKEEVHTHQTIHKKTIRKD